VTVYIPRLFTRPQTVTRPSTNPTSQRRESNLQPVDHKSDALTTTPPSHLLTCSYTLMHSLTLTYLFKDVGLLCPGYGKSSTSLSGWGYGKVCSLVSGGRQHCVIPYGK